MRWSVSLFLLLLLACSRALGQVGNDNLTGPAGIFNGDVTSAGDYDPYTGNVRRSIIDIAVAGTVGTQPLALVRTANSRGSGQWKYGFGTAGNWRHNYMWSLSTDENTVSGFSPSSYSVNFPDGRSVSFAYSSSDAYYRGPTGVTERFVPLSGGVAYLVLSDNTRIQFQATQYTDPQQVCDQYDHCHTVTYYGYNWLAQAIIDPYGLRTTLTYTTIGSDQVLYQVTEPAGRWLRFSYVTTPWNNYTGQPDVLLQTVTASDGRSVLYRYGGMPFSPGTYEYSFLSKVDSTATAISRLLTPTRHPMSRPTATTTGLRCSKPALTPCTVARCGESPTFTLPPITLTELLLLSVRSRVKITIPVQAPGEHFPLSR